MRANAVDVVKSLVFEAGVKSLSLFCTYRTLPVVSETISMPQYPRARSGSARIGGDSRGSGFRLAAWSCVPSSRQNATDKTPRVGNGA